MYCILTHANVHCTKTLLDLAESRTKRFKKLLQYGLRMARKWTGFIKNSGPVQHQTLTHDSSKKIVIGADSLQA